MIAIKSLMGSLLNRALGTGAIGNMVENVLGEVAGVVIGHLGAGAINTAAATLHQHFTLSGHELGLAFQDSLGRGLAAIALGVSAPSDEGGRWWQPSRVRIAYLYPTLRPGMGMELSWSSLTALAG